MVCIVHGGRKESDTTERLSHFIAPWKKSYNKPRQHIKKQKHHFVDKCPSSQSYGFCSGHVQMCELDHKDGRVLKNRCFWTVVLEKTLWESLGQQGDKVSQSLRKSTLNIHLKDWCWSSNTLVTWCKELTHWKRPGKDWRQKGVTEDEMVVWHRLNGQGFEQILGDGEGQGSLACCSPWGCTVKHDWAIEPQ